MKKERVVFLFTFLASSQCFSSGSKVLVTREQNYEAYSELNQASKGERGDEVIDFQPGKEPKQCSSFFCDCLKKTSNHCCGKCLALSFVLSADKLIFLGFF